jgi:hypothetical protein
MKGKFSFSPLREDFREKEKGIFISTHLLYLQYATISRRGQDMQ